jgi:pectin-derived oligosaccharide transport system substrate-binding protein
VNTSLLSRRGFLGGVGALAALTACGPRIDDDGVLDVALWGDAKRADLYRKALDLFVGANGGLRSDLQFADLKPYLERLATSAAAHDLPDVLWMRDTHIGRYGSAGALLDLRPFLGSAIDVSGIGDVALADGTIDGGVYALPTHYVGQAVLTDRLLVGRRGIDFARVTTWAELADAARETADRAAGTFGIADPTTGTTHRHLEAWIRQRGEELFGGDHDIGFTASTVEEWFEYWRKLRADGVVPPADVQIESEASGWTNDLLTTGRTAIRLASTNHLTIVQGLTETPIGLHSVPADPTATPDWWFFPPILISVAATAGAPEVAARLVGFFLDDGPAGRITKVNQGAPSSSAVRDEILDSLTEGERAFVEQISREQQQPRRPFPVRPQGSEGFNTMLTSTGQEIAYGQTSITEAVAALVDAAPSVLAGA